LASGTEEITIKKVIVIGLDGLEPRVVARLIQAGELPNLARLRESGGTMARVATTRPAQTPVAWSTFATGVNPGGHGIFDFLRRNPKTYLPELAFSKYEQKNLFRPPKAVNLRGGTPVWDLLTSAGRSATIIRCPCTYPPDRIQGRMLSGMGVPDLRGGLGTPTFYTTDPSAKPRESERLVHPRPLGDGLFAIELIGPRDPRTGGDTKIEATLRIDDTAGRGFIRSDGTPSEIEVSLGGWSGWLRVKFKLGMLQSVRGMLRFHLAACGPKPELYASPVNFDPDAPLFGISEPPEYAGELARRIGLFHTTGMVEDHTGLNNERLTESAFLDQCETAWREREAMMLDGLRSFDDGLFYCLFDTPDRIQHLFWRYTEPGHPANLGTTPDPAFASAIDDAYRRCDVIVGRALEFADDNTLFIAMSDHGFNSFQRGVHLNTWLHDNGFLKLKEGLEPGEAAGDLLRQVDWGQTKAYALGLGGIYLNLAGREERGIVSAGDAASVRGALIQGLTGLTDPGRNGTASINRVVPRETAYSGPHVSDAPDLLVDFAPGYRVSWSSSMGGIAEGHFENNVRKWSGDHIIDPEQVPGVLFMNRSFRGEGARLLDLAPTILDALGVPKGPAMEGSSLRV
jgi:predicted AlkP superfamily phosphohydrolase/phosphomutase